MTKKKCSACGTEKSVSCFYKRKEGYRGLSSRCIACQYKDRGQPVRSEERILSRSFVNTAEHKLCAGCKVKKETKYFWTKGGGRFQSRCIACMRRDRGSDPVEVRVRKALVRTVNDGTQKLCSSCKEMKDVSLFWRCKSAKDGLQHKCKKCARMFAAALRQTHREKVRKYHSDRRYKEKLSLSPGSPMWWKKKYGYNRVREIYVGATWEQLKVLYENTPFCFYCGIAVGPTEMCFDHRIPRSRGGATGISNICVACPGCNRLKWNLTPDEFETYQLAYVMQVLKHRDAKRQKFTQAEKRA